MLTLEVTGHQLPLQFSVVFGVCPSQSIMTLRQLLQYLVVVSILLIFSSDYLFLNIMERY